MKNLYRYLSPFSPDQSGAVSVLYELGGIIVILDAGGCAGNICGFDEPRWFRAKSAVYSAGLRDLDAILGRDDKLMTKLSAAVETYDANFIALIGTPVPAVVGTDLRALTRMAEKKFGLPCVAIDSNGMEYYDIGQQKSYMALLRLTEQGKLDGAGDASAEPPVYETGILGATPLDLPADDSARQIIRRAEEQGYGKTVCFGMESGLAEFRRMMSVKRNLVVSPSGLAPARALQDKYGIPFETGFLFSGDEGVPKEFEESCIAHDDSILVIHQQIYAGAVRDALRRKGYRNVTVASFFTMDPAYMEAGDLTFRGENDLIRAAGSGYAAILGDPTFARALGGFRETFVPLPHYAVSGEMHETAAEQELYA